MYVLIFKYMALLAVKKLLKREVCIHNLGRLRTFGERTVSTEVYVLHWGLYVHFLLS